MNSNELIYIGLSEDKRRIEHIVLIHSYNEYTPNDFLSTDDYTILYNANSDFKLVNILADLDIEPDIDFILESRRETFQFLFSRNIKKTS